MSLYHRVTEYYRCKARRRIDEIMPHLQPRYQLSLEMIYQLYLQIFDLIDPEHGNFSSEELNPGPDAVNRRIHSTIETFTPITG